MNWRPWKRRETREASGYASIITAALHRAASGNIGQLSDLAAIQGSAALLGRALSVARVEPAAPLVEGVTPEFLYSVGTRLVLEGRAVDLLDIGPDGIPRFYPASHWTLTGTYRRDTHVYVLELAGADGEAVVKQTAGAENVFDVVSGSRWQGSSAAILGASSTARSALELEAALADEAAMPRGALYAVPGATDPDGTEWNELRAAIGDLRGGVALIEHTGTGHDRPELAGRSSEAPRRIGFDAPSAAVSLRMGLEQSLVAATGTPGELLGISQQLTADRRELLRSYRASTVEPIAGLVAAELSRVLETDVRLVFKTSTPADLVSRARAFRKP